MMLSFADSLFWFCASRVLLGLVKHSGTMCKLTVVDTIDDPGHEHDNEAVVQEKARLIGRQNMFEGLGFVCGPILGGILIKRYDYSFRDVARIVSISFLFWATIVAMMFRSLPAKMAEIASGTSPKHKKHNRRNSTSLSEMGQALSDAWYTNTSLVHLLILRSLLSFSVQLFRSNFLMIMERRHNTTAEWNGYILSYSGLMGAIGAATVGRVRQYSGSDVNLIQYVSVGV